MNHSQRNEENEICNNLRLVPTLIILERKQTKQTTTPNISMIFFRWPRHRALRPHRRRTEVGGEHHDRRPREDDELGRVSPARGHVRVHGLPRGYVSFENSGTFSLVNFLNILTKILKIRKIDPISELPRRRGLLKVSKPFYLAEEISICLIRVKRCRQLLHRSFPSLTRRDVSRDGLDRGHRPVVRGTRHEGYKDLRRRRMWKEARDVHRGR